MTGTVPPTDGRTDAASASSAVHRRRIRPECQSKQVLAGPAPRSADTHRRLPQPVCGPDTLRINGGRRLGGRVTVSGSATSTQFLLSAAATLTYPIRLEAVPQSPQIAASLALLTRYGWQVEQQGSQLSIAPAPDRSLPDAPALLFDSGLIDVPDHLVPALLRATGAVVVPRPCEESAAVHELGLVYKAFGDDFRTTEHGYAVTARPRTPAHVEISLLDSSQQATVCAMLRAVSAGVELTLERPDASPETRAVWDALTAVGHTGTLTAHRLHLTPRRSRAQVDLWLVPGDRIETMIYASAIAATGGSGSIDGAPARSLPQVRALLGRVGIGTHTDADRALNIHPGHDPGTTAWDGIRVQVGSGPSDLDPAYTPMLTAVALALPGRHLLAERSGPLDLKVLLAHLEHLGAHFAPTGTGAASFIGPQALHGAQLVASDERCAAATLIAALTAAGTTIVEGADRLLLRHPRLIVNLTRLGAEIEVVR